MNQGPYQPYNGQQPPPYPGQFQPQLNQQRPRGFRQWFRTRRPRTKFALGCGTLFVALFLCLGSLAAYGSTLPKSKAFTQPTSVANTPSSQPTQVIQVRTVQPTTLPSPTPTFTPTATPSPTPTATPRPLPTPIPTISASSVMLGGAINAFDKKLGAENCCYYNGWDPPTGPYVAVWDDSYNSLGFDESSPNRVVRISMNPQGDGSGGNPTWNATTASQLCDAYLPPDAVYQSGYQVFLANVVTGYTKVYYSALLAHTLPTKDFTDTNGNPDKLGTIYVYMSYNYDADHIGHCSLGIRGKDDLEY